MSLACCLVPKFEKCSHIINHIFDCRLVRNTKHTADNLRFIRRVRLLSVCTLMQILAMIGTGETCPRRNPKLKFTASLLFTYFTWFNRDAKIDDDACNSWKLQSQIQSQPEY